VKWQTIYLGRLLGLFTIITVIWLAIDKQATISMLPILLGNRPVMMVLAFISLAAGLAIVLAHNIWSGGLLPVLVTLIGWLMVIRGVLFLFLSYQDLTSILAAMQFGALFYLYLLIPFAVGVCLTYLSFIAPTPSRD
jgi:hypothetical protein